MKKFILDPFEILIEPVATFTKSFDRLEKAMLTNPKVVEYLKGSTYRLLSRAFFPNDEKHAQSLLCKSPFVDSYCLYVYDYTRNICLKLLGNAKNFGEVEIVETNIQPIPTQEEFDDAVRQLLKSDDRLKKAFQENMIRLYKPMPPLVELPLDNGSVERTLTVGIQSLSGNFRSEIIGLNMINGKIIHFDRGAPDHSSGDGDHCGVPNANQGTTKNASGQYWLTISKNGSVLWKLLVIRPSASSGTNGSGVELKFVDYKGKRVLYQGHVPILNVRYDNDKCGPYRDWQNEEGTFDANGIDVAPGIRLCTAPPKTILQSGSDSGSFKGVAIYATDDEVILMSEMEAGWYRYISEWHLKSNGDILPKFGFAAVQSNCVCNKHHHHVYWRLDFDIETSSNNRVEEFNDPVLVGNSNWHKKSFEIRRLKDTTRKRKWKISNIATDSAYILEPGSNDGVADSFGVGDFWAVRYKGASEIDDGVGFTTDLNLAKAHIDNFVNGESLDGKDIVIWYGAHFTHDVHVNVGHIVGPTLRCGKW
jgi:hypothetical protein